MIELDSVSKTYDGPGAHPHRALDDVSFVAREGRVTALLGRNGAGKTTALRVVSTILRPTAGRARVLGFDALTQGAEVRARLGFLSPSIGLFERLTCREVVEFFGSMYELAPAAVARRLDELVDLLDLAPILDRTCATLSTGERQRVQLARALVHDPPVVVLDEPTSGLDVVVTHALLAAIESLRARTRTILISTHSFAEVERLADDAVVLDHGSVVFAGSREELASRAGSTEAAVLGLISTPGEPRG